MPEQDGSTLTFENLHVDAGNRVAAAAGRRVSESPGRSYNPLFVFGPAGVGKSHLLGAIAHRAAELDPELRIRQESMDSILDRAAASVASGRLGEFRESFADLDLLIVDDLHRAGGHDRVQAVLGRVVEEMMGRGAQVVIASDQTPQDIDALDAALAARLASGLVIDIAPAEEETRRAIILRFAEERGVDLGGEIVAALAAMSIRSAHELRGAVHRLATEGAASGGSLTPADLPRLLNLEPEPEENDGDEFGAFLSDISTAVAAVVEESPWRRRLARAILSWEGEGFRTRRLEEALDSDDVPEIEVLLDGFERDVARLRQIARALPEPPPDPGVLRDPDRLAEAEEALAAAESGRPRQTAALLRPVRPAGTYDAWYRDTEKIAWAWLALDDRIIEEKG
jgi:chromosomal replication initiator protein